MKYLSLFSGIGGFEIGIQQALFNKELRNDNRQENTLSRHDKPDSSRKPDKRQQATCIGYSEIDKYAIKVYERHFKHETDGSITDKQPCRACTWHTRHLNKEGYCEDCWHKNYGDATRIVPEQLPDFDLLVGGFPCQAFSVAGKRHGFNDTRGTLFFDIARILKHKRPRHLVLENVKGLLSHDSGKTFTTILGVLSDLGYDVEWQVLNAKDFGVPQNRERIFIVGHLGGECGRQIFPITGSSQQIATVAGYISEEVWPRRHEQIRRVYKTDGAMPTIPTGQGGGVMTKIAIKSAATRTRAYSGKPETLEVRKDKVSNALNSITKDYYATDLQRIRRLTPIECERLMGFPDGWTAGESDTQRYKMCGNAVVTNVVEAVISKLRPCL